jgi:hypothetical protein
VFNTFIPDKAMELTAGQFCSKEIHAGSTIRPVEALSQNQILAESAIQELREKFRKAMLATNKPPILCGNCLQLLGNIRSHSVLDILELDGDMPTRLIMGDTANISHLCDVAICGT